MRKGLVILGFMGLALASEVSIIETETFNYVKVSLTDINRIVCFSEVSNVVYSKEKEIEVKVSGRNVYVKFLPKVIDSKTEISSIPRELYVECGGKVFQLILLPEKNPASLIVLKSSYVDKERALKYEKANPYDQTMLELIRSVYMEVPPEGYEMKVINKPYKTFAELEMVLYREYDGVRYRVREFILLANMDIELWEGQFIQYLEKPLAIAIVKPILRKGENTRLIAVELKDA